MLVYKPKTVVVKNRVSDFRVIGGPPVLLKLFLSTTPHIRDKNVLAKFKLRVTSLEHLSIAEFSGE